MTLDAFNYDSAAEAHLEIDSNDLHLVEEPTQRRPTRKLPLYGMSSANLQRSIAHAKGVYLTDNHGRRLLDCASGAFDNPLGYHHPVITDAMRNQMETLQYSPSAFVPDVLVQLADELIEVTPKKLNRVHLRDITGSTAVEGAIKIAQFATGKRDVIALFASHHGQTAYTTDISGNAFRREPYPVHMSGVVHVPGPDCSRCFYRTTPDRCGMLCADRIEDFIEYASTGKVACIIVEPVSGNGGNVVPPPDYLPRLRELCDRMGIVLIFDEIQTGIGRTGYMTAAERFGVEPDIMVLGKGLGGPTPRGAILLNEELEQMPRAQHSHCGGSNLLSVAVALATVRAIKAPGFLEGVREVGDYLGAGLKALGEEFDFVGDVRGVGMMWGMAMVDEHGNRDPERTNRLAANGLNHGLVLRTSRYGRGEVLKIRPPLILTREQADEILLKLRGLFAEDVR